MGEFKPTIVAAHSLGSLLTYDTFTHDQEGRDAIDGLTYLTFGSESIAFVQSARAWAGRSSMLWKSPKILVSPLQSSRPGSDP